LPPTCQIAQRILDILFVSFLFYLASVEIVGKAQHDHLILDSHRFAAAYQPFQPKVARP